ncbi:MAG: HAD family phosphatase [Ruminococcus sp.]|nr:HAD family phosphatase [Ruminococcus sp.]
MSIKGAVFDMDGLMFDTENLTYKLQKEILAEAGLEFSLDDYKKTIGKRLADLPVLFYGLFGESYDFDRFRLECRNAYIKYTEEYGIPVKDGLFELLDELKEKGIKIALATSTARRSAERTLKIAGVFDYFDELVCAEDVKNGKPDPEPFLKAAEKLSLEPSECIALEDSINGIKSAYLAGMKTVMVPDLIEPDDEIKAMCDLILGSLNELKI